MSLVLYQVDAFSDRPFSGNPAAVCLLDAARPDAWMLSLAQEMNLSETAFLLPEADGWRLRWFSPVAEVSLCGHATLASAHILWETGRLAPGDTARFYTLSGLLSAVRLADGWIELNFPSRPPAAVQPLPGLVEALGSSQASFCGRNKNTWLLELENEDAVRRTRPNFAALAALEEVRATIITARASTPGFDFVSRYFVPKIGINEDPVTGSAHTLLTPYWAARLQRLHLTAYQASTRGGALRLRQDGERVGIAGQAVTVFKGELEA